jgi:hypothetical protein
MPKKKLYKTFLWDFFSVGANLCFFAQISLWQKLTRQERGFSQS